MAKQSNTEQVFRDFLSEWLKADTATRESAAVKAQVLNRAEQAGLDKATLKICASLEKMDGVKRNARLTTLLLYARYAGHDEQLDMFSEVSTEDLERAAANHEMEAERGDDADDEDTDDDTVDMEEFLADEEDEISEADKKRLEDAASDDDHDTEEEDDDDEE